MTLEGATLTSVGPSTGAAQRAQTTTKDTDTVSDAERELYGGRLRYDQSFVRHEGPLTRLGFGHMAAALPRMMGKVLVTGWQTDRRALAGVVAAQLGQGVTAGWGLVAVNSVLTELFANGPTADKLRDALPSLVVLAVTAVATALLAAWSTAMSGRLEPQVERAISARYYAAVTGVEVAATERPQVQRVLEAGRFGTDSARNMLRLSVGVGNVAIGVGDRPRDMAAVRRAARDAAVADLVEGLPHGWDSIVFKGYERGVQLSGGQWQKLGTARTLYRDAPVLLVDEPTATLDPHAEIAAFRSLWSLAEQGHAVVLVTHRLAATMNADHIYVLDEGRIVEDGNHADLMARGRLYQGMFTAQAAQYGLAPATGTVPGPRGTLPAEP